MIKETKDAKIFFRLTNRDKKRLDRTVRREGFEDASSWVRKVVLEAIERSKLKIEAA